MGGAETIFGEFSCIPQGPLAIHWPYTGHTRICGYLPVLWVLQASCRGKGAPVWHPTRSLEMVLAVVNSAPQNGARFGDENGAHLELKTELVLELETVAQRGRGTDQCRTQKLLDSGVHEKVDTEGFEPSTSRMRNGRSSTELSAHLVHNTTSQQHYGAASPCSLMDKALAS